MAEKKFFVDINLQGSDITNLKADTLDITSNLASANTKRIAYHNGSYYYSDGTSWNILATALGYNPEDQANKSSNTSLGTSNILYPTQNAVKVYADNLLGNANALIYKGVIDCSTNPNYPAADAGWMYIASVAGKIGGASGTDVEVGDMIICNTDGTVSGNQATVGQYWNIIQKNIIGAVTGPASSVSNNVVFFDGTTGKIIKDSGLTLSGTNTGDETTATIKTKLSAASSSTDGYLTSTDWSTFDNKGNGTVSSVGLSMPSAFTVGSSPVTGSGTITVTGAGATSQYVRGDGTLANFPSSTGGGSSLAFYLNGSVSQGTFGGVAFKEIDKTPVLGAGTDFTINANGYIQSFITDAGVPGLLNIPSGNWNFETYFSASSSGGTPSFYVELYKWDGATLSLIASSSANPEVITGGTAIDLYTTALAVPQTTLLATDRLAVRIYVTHSGRTITLHTEDNHLCEIITTFSTGLTALNGLTAQVQNLAVGTTGTDFAISSVGTTHTFNLPTASATNRGALSSTDWSTFNNKQAALSGTGFVKISGTTISYDNSTYLTGNQTVTLSGDVTGSGATGITTSISATTVTGKLITGFVSGAGTVAATDSILGAIQKLDGNTSAKIGGSGTANYVSKFTASGTIGNSLIQDNGTYLGISTAPVTGVRITVDGVANTAIRGNTTGNGKYGLHGSSVNDGPGTFTGVFGASTDNGSSFAGSVYVGGRFFASNGNNTTDVYSLWLQDGTESIGRFLKSITADGKSQWATLTVADTGLALTTTGTSGAATLVGNTLNIPTYESSLIPKLQGNEIWRGHTFRNNSTTFDSTAGLTLSTTGTNTARSVATTSYAARGIRMGVTASIVATGRYTGIRGGVLLWYVSGGFLYTGEFNISDTATAAGTHNFWGLASSTSDLVIGDVANSQPSALTNIIAFANDSGDANLQIMYNDASGTATKTDLGSSFPSNRTAGAAITTIYSCYLYNAPGSTSVIYRIVNKETGAVAQGTLSTNLPASTVGLNFFGIRTMGTTGGGVTNSGQFDVYRLGVYSL